MAPISLSAVKSLASVSKRYALSSSARKCRSIPCLTRSFSDQQHETTSVHFRATTTPHPLATEANNLKASKPVPTISGLDKDGNPLVEVAMSPGTVNINTVVRISNLRTYFVHSLMVT